MENSSGEVQQQFGNNDIKKLRLAAWGGGQGEEKIEVRPSNSPFVSKSGYQERSFSQNYINIVSLRCLVEEKQITSGLLHAEGHIYS